MDADEVRRLLLKNLGLRIEPEMSRYLASRLQQTTNPVTVMAGDARTGAPVRRLITPLDLSQSPFQQGLP